MPLAPTLLFYLIIYQKEAKHDCDRSFALLQKELTLQENIVKVRDRQLKNMQILDRVRLEKIDNLTNQVIDLNIMLDDYKTFDSDDDIEFIAITETNVGEDGSTTEVSFVVPE